MRMLYYDRWVDVPAPGSESTGARVRVTHSCSAGQQQEVRARVTALEQVQALVRQSPRLARSTVRHLQTYGLRKTLQAVRGHTAGHHLASARTSSSFCGRPVDDAGGLESTRVAGYRHDGALFVELQSVHVDQTAPVPAGLAAADAATVLYYAIALATAQRIEEMGRSVAVVVGQPLHALILRDLLESNGRSVLVPSPNDADSMAGATRALDGGAALVLTHKGAATAFARWANHAGTLYAGTFADTMRAADWLELESRWIGLPHAEVRTLHIASKMPMEVAPAFSRDGLARALEHMRKSDLQPSRHTRRCEVERTRAGETVDLSLPRLFSLEAESPSPPTRVRPAKTAAPLLRVAAVGLGSWGTETLFPLVARNPRAQLALAVDRNPMQLVYTSQLLNIPKLGNLDEAIDDPNIDALFVATRHDTHCDIAVRALRAGKAVFLEKPLVLELHELDELRAALGEAPRPVLAAGFNRPYWQWTPWLRERIAEVPGPVTISAIVRELRIHRTHYYNWPHMGTRIVSNGCHWIDLAHHLLGGRAPLSVQVVSTTDDPERAQANNVVVVRYRDGSSANLVFCDAGDTRPLVHEYIDIKTQRSHYRIDDFRRLSEFRDGMVREIWSGKAERGWERCVGAAIDGMLDGVMPRPFAELAMSTTLVLEARASFLSGGSVRHIAPGSSIPDTSHRARSA